jgi:hypothetical protein
MNTDQSLPAGASSKRSKIPLTSYKVWAYGFLMLFFVIVFVIIFAAHLLPGQPSSTHQMVKVCLAITIIILVFFVSVYEVYDAATTRHLRAPFLIFGLTVASLFAFGWEDTNGLLLPNIRELFAIFVLFVLSELTLLLTKKIEVAEEKTESVTGAITVLAENIADIKGSLERSDLVESARKMSGLAKSFEQLFTIRHAGAWQHVFNEVTVNYTGVWSDEVKRVLASRSEDEIGREAVLLCWKALLSTYVNEERADILSSPPQIATNQKMYLALLESLAKSVSEPGSVFRQDGRIPVLLGISNVLPEYWFNWQISVLPTKAYQYLPIDNYRNLVTRLVKEAKENKALEYHRLLLVDGDDTVLAKQGIKSLAALKDQAKLLILTPVGLLSPTALEGEILQRFKNACWNWSVFQNNPDAKSCYFIVTHEELKEVQQYLQEGQAIKSLADSKSGYEIEIHYSDWRQKLLVERLAVKFLHDLHTEIDHAKVAQTHLTAQSALDLMQNDHDVLMVGFKGAPNSPVQWQLALTTNLQPGIDTMLLHVIYDKDELAKLAKWQAGESGIRVNSFAQEIGLGEGEY